MTWFSFVLGIAVGVIGAFGIGAVLIIVFDNPEKDRASSRERKGLF